MATLSASVFLAHLERSGLLAPDQLAEIRAHAAKEAESAASKPLAAWLVERGLITRWQARQLLAGRHGFFVGKYRLLDHLGSGGMGVVYKAVHARLERLVALKVIRAELLAQSDALRRFEREMRIAAALDHPHIVRVYDADSVGNVHFLAMEYVDGYDLGWWLARGGALTVGDACECIRQAAQGLQHAHQRDLAHRDIKPANLLVSQDVEGGPVVKLVDLGLARLLGERRSRQLTDTGRVMGTPDYMAPEQAQDSRSVDIRSDIYGLGCTLFELLTGTVPFAGESAVERLVARLVRDPPALGERCEAAPAELAAVVSRMLARDPADRYQTPGEVADALTPLADPGVGVFDLSSEGSDVHDALAPATPNRPAESADTGTVPSHLPVTVRDEVPDEAQLGVQAMLEQLAETQESDPLPPVRIRPKRWWSWVLTTEAFLAISIVILIAIALATMPADSDAPDDDPRSTAVSADTENDTKALPHAKAEPRRATANDPAPPDETWWINGYDSPQPPPPGVIAVLGNPKMTHWATPSDLAISPDGRVLASSAQSGKVVRPVSWPRPLTTTPCGSGVTTP